MIKPVFLATDLVLFALVLALGWAIVYVRRSAPLAAQWARVFMSRQGMASSVVLVVMLGVSLLDSLHFRTPLPQRGGSESSPAVQAYSPKTLSLLDTLLDPLRAGQEKTYSAPLKTTQLSKETVLINGASLRDNPPLKLGGAHLRAEQVRGEIDNSLALIDIVKRAVKGMLIGALIGGALAMVWLAILLAGAGLRFKDASAFLKRAALPWRTGFAVVFFICVLSSIAWHISLGWHLLGTDRAGNDLLFTAIKSIRTALAIGLITVLVSLPFALILGIAAGTLRGKVDTAIQYGYTVLSSIPGVLLVAACVLMIQSYIDNNATRYATALERADVKLLLLCTVLGLTSWAGFARLLRAEAMKLREMDFVLAAKSFGVPQWQIMLRHIAPNTLHLVILTVSMEFSALVLYEAVLSYIGIGVDPAIHSFGGMINGARTELARNPIVWWPLASAFSFMLALVLAANVFADCIRDAFDPKFSYVGVR